eukprot:5491131-Pyramimonas_sp.AAC.1
MLCPCVFCRAPMYSAWFAMVPVPLCVLPCSCVLCCAPACSAVLPRVLWFQPCSCVFCRAHVCYSVLSRIMQRSCAMGPRNPVHALETYPKTSSILAHMVLNEPFQHHYFEDVSGDIPLATRVLNSRCSRSGGCLGRNACVCAKWRCEQLTCLGRVEWHVH